MDKTNTIGAGLFQVTVLTAREGIDTGISVIPHEGVDERHTYYEVAGQNAGQDLIIRIEELGHAEAPHGTMIEFTSPKGTPVYRMSAGGKDEKRITVCGGTESYAVSGWPAIEEGTALPDTRAGERTICLVFLTQ